MLGKEIVSADYQDKELQGGTISDVRLITGTAHTPDGGNHPYNVVLKTLKKWERPGDPNSWRREYDLYTSDFGEVLYDTFRWPQCYYAEDTGDKLYLWLEHIEGISGVNLGINELEFVAEELGRFQGRISDNPTKLASIPFLSDPGALKRNFDQWHTQTLPYEFLISDQCWLPEFVKQLLSSGKIRLYQGKSFEYSCLRSKACDLPEHLRRMLTELDDKREAIFESFKRLPIVLCHRDFWVENIFACDGKIRLLDWDCAGWGYLGEDIASLIYDEIQTDCLHECFQRLIPAYIKGISENLDIPIDFRKIIPQMILIVFGYRTLQNYMFTQSSEVKREQIERLQKVYEMMEG